MDCSGAPIMRTANKISAWLVGAISITAFFTLAACGTHVVGGGSGGSGANSTTSSANGGSGGNGTGGSGAAGGNPGSSDAISMLYSELQSPDPAGGTTAASTGSAGGPDGNTLYIAISNTPEVCAELYAAEPCGNHYRVGLGIPVALQKVGIIALNDPSIISYYSWSGLADNTGQCPGGGGSFIDGELEITDIDSTHVQGILTNTDTFDFDANGVFDAPRCVF